MKKHKIRLKPVSLKGAKGHECPGIKVGKTQYLVKNDGRYACGDFSRQWYGLNFDGFYDAGLQFDAPGSNHSRWQAIWEIIEV